MFNKYIFYILKGKSLETENLHISPCEKMGVKDEVTFTYNIKVGRFHYPLFDFQQAESHLKQTEIRCLCQSNKTLHFIWSFVRNRCPWVLIQYSLCFIILIRLQPCLSAARLKCTMHLLASGHRVLFWLLARNMNICILKSIPDLLWSHKRCFLDPKLFSTQTCALCFPLTNSEISVIEFWIFMLCYHRLHAHDNFLTWPRT